MIRILRNLIFGGIGGALGWALVEPSNYLTPPDQWGPVPPDWGRTLLLGCIVGAAMGLCIGISEGIASGSGRMARRSAFLGLVTGLVGGLLGLMFGQAFYGPLAGLGNAAPIFVGFVLLLFARAFGWSFIGLFIGASQGIPTLSTKRMRNGAIGGFLGGGVGGAAFEILGRLNAVRLTQAAIFPGPMLRFIGFTITGAAIGLFIGFVEELLKQAWIVKLSGAGEGRQYILSKPMSMVGRSEMADVPIFGDTSVAPAHAVLRMENGRYVIEDQGSPAGTLVNGQPMQRTVLKDGDIIQLGGTRLGFREKATASRFAPPVDLREAAKPSIPTSDRICPYCGSMKDAQGNCACTVGAAIQSPATPIPPAAAQPSSSPAPTGLLRLVGVSGPYAGQSFELPPSGELTVGREEGREICLQADSTVSRMHARVSISPAGVVLMDEGSLNGTFVNDARISRQPLTVGDMIQIGNTKFKFER